MLYSYISTEKGFYTFKSYHDNMWSGIILVPYFLDHKNFVRWTQKMTSTFFCTFCQVEKIPLVFFFKQVTDQ